MMNRLKQFLYAFFCLLYNVAVPAETFVLVHGAFQDASCWDKLIPLIKKAGHQAIAVNLPGRRGNDADAEKLTIDSYAEAVIKVIREQSQPVALVGHSAGGITISAVAEAVPDRIKRLIYVSAYLPVSGQSLQTLSSSDTDSLLAKGAFTVVDGKYAEVKADSRAMAFGNDAEPALQKKIAASLIREPLPPLAQQVTLTAEKFGAVRKLYVLTRNDNTVSPNLQRRMLKATPVDQVFELDSGHAPYMTAPKQLAAAILSGTSHVLFEKPPGSFLENILVESDGSMLVTSHEDGQLIKLNPSGRATVFATIPGKPASIIEYSGAYLVAGWNSQGKPTLFKVSRQGKVGTLMNVEGAVFLNGIAHFVHNKTRGYLVTDSYRGVIWFVDPKAKTGKIWMENAAFTRIDEKNPSPGINGLKVTANKILVTNSQRQSIYEIAVDNGAPTGEPKLLATGFPMDDFAVANDGSVLVATHPANSVVRIAANGTVTRIAAATDGVVGATSVAFGRTANDKNSVYVTTNGGLWSPPAGGIQSAKVVRVDLGPPQ